MLENVSGLGTSNSGVLDFSSTGDCLLNLKTLNAKGTGLSSILFAEGGKL
jgi:hypothetical protein